MTVTSRLGRVRPIHRGAWSAAASYEPLDIVTYNNRSYFCIQAATAFLPTNTTYWSVVAEPSGVTLSVGKGLTMDGAEAGGAPLSENRVVGLVVLPETKASKRNRHLNPAFQFCQDRGAGVTAVFAGGSAYSFDGVYITAIGGGALTCQQLIKASPGGSPYRFRGVASTVDAALAAGDVYHIQFPIEGSDVADLMFGTANAKSFVWRGVVNLPAGTYGLSFCNAAGTRSYVVMFTIAAGATDTLITAVVPGDTSGTWISDSSGTGIQARICLASGTSWQTATPDAWTAGNYLTTSAQTNVMAVANNNFELCDIGLYAGTELPDWEMPDYAEDLRRCERYYAILYHSSRFWAVSSGNTNSAMGYWPVTMRGVPSLNLTVGPRNNLASLVYSPQTGDTFTVDMISAASGDTYALAEKLIGNARL